ncbi:MAG: hypothetical protein HYX34_10095 [Actinobacteria bacterium]|nr:hypothetical protein [Actinomycetota bacterium]
MTALHRRRAGPAPAGAAGTGSAGPTAAGAAPGGAAPGGAARGGAARGGAAPGGSPREGLAPLPWRAIVRATILGVVLMLALVARDVGRNNGGNFLSVVQPGARGPSAEVIRRDFPGVRLPADVGLDGQMTYSIARNPLHPAAVAPALDRPQYRLRRPLLSLAGWALHPTGGGMGLVWALLAVGVAMVVVGALATGVLGATFGQRPWLAAVFPLLPGAYWSVRVTVADAMALALALGAIALALRRRPVAAVAVAVLAVLAKEPAVLVFAGWALWRRDRRSAAMVAVPAAVALAWALALRSLVPAGASGPGEISLVPFAGLVQATTDLWLRGRELVGMASSIAALSCGVVAVARRRGHPLWWAIVVQLGFTSIMSSNVIGMNFGGTRSTMPLLLLSLVALATRRRTLPDAGEPATDGRGRALDAAAPVPG